ncbi:hypothetical protein ACELLULO517_28215 [Acidisoma cellulosilytica]|uniref:Uncharacterized protein n=1 Tax=Acidisoma cellulosilyticum TaxID=2802395 RepID=A0A963Z7Q9_9PROT|nr:hypothetical protein [Acidisoma cellulosilyticum]MCB8884128.1 hypothetical protein [Acidisoma cellulosilyticum]
MASDIFADRLVDIVVTGTLVRLDFANIDPLEKEKHNQPSLAFSRRLVMPIEGFLAMSDSLSKMIAIMIEKGTIVSRNDANLST